MASSVNDRGAGGEGSIMFRQNLEYPRAPGQITYYPPEPSEDLRRQVKKDRAGGIVLYVIGFVITVIGFMGARNFSDTIDIYSMLIPLLLILGLVFAIMYLVLNNVTLAKLARAMPMILIICLILLYIMSILISIMDLSHLGDGAPDEAVGQSFENLIFSLLNPAFFLMSAGLMSCRSGGTMLWTSTKISNQFIPGMIIIETPMAGHAETPMAVGAQTQQQSQPTAQPKEVAKTCQHCQNPLEYINQYDRHYCYSCKEYAPKDA